MDNTEKLAKLGTQDTRRRRKTKQNIHHYRKTNTNNVNKTRALLQATTFLCSVRTFVEIKRKKKIYSK